MRVKPLYGLAHQMHFRVQEGEVEFELTCSDLKRLIDATSFSMAQQDVRYYLNGMSLETEENTIRTVATDGHRLALCHFG